MIWSTVCRWTRSCGLTSVNRSAREPPAAGASSRSRQKCCAPAAALAVVCPRGASCVSGPAHFGAEWCWAAARAILTLSCSWRQPARPPSDMGTACVPKQRGHLVQTTRATLNSERLVVVVGWEGRGPQLMGGILGFRHSAQRAKEAPQCSRVDVVPASKGKKKSSQYGPYLPASLR